LIDLRGLRRIAQQKSHHARTKHTPPRRPASVSLTILHCTEPGASFPVDESSVPAAG
jgi:hypothetical protein